MAEYQVEELAFHLMGSRDSLMKKVTHNCKFSLVAMSTRTYNRHSCAEKQCESPCH